MAEVPTTVLGKIEFFEQHIPVATPEATYYLITHRDELSSEATEPITVRFGFADQTGNSETTDDSGGLSLAA